MELLVSETWRDIPNVAGYKISTIGNVWSNKRGRCLTSIVDRTGRKRIRLSDGRGTKSFYIHDLMRSAFFQGVPTVTSPTYLNGSLTDNRLENLCFRRIGEYDEPGEGEEWRAVNGYEGLYQVSNRGNVRALSRMINSPNGKRRIAGRTVRIANGRGGYPCVYLSKNSCAKGHYVHRLVAEAFIENPLGLPEINHKDETRTNNDVSNLEWCDHRYNMNYGTAIDRANAKRKQKYESNRKQRGIL